MTNSAIEADILIAGGGLAGLSAAYLLSRKGYRVVVCEEDNQVGGRARSLAIDGGVVDLGAQFVSDFYHTTLDIIASLGLSEELTPRSMEALIVRQLTPIPMWPLSQLVRQDCLSATAKARLLCLVPELLKRWRDLDITDLRRGEDFDSESAAVAINRICGREDLDYFFGPLMRALLYWEAGSTSMLVVLAILKAFLTSKRTFRFRNGIGLIADGLANGLDVRRGVQVREIHHGKGCIHVTVTDGPRSSEIRSAGLICATPATAAAEAVRGLSKHDMDFLKSVSYTRTAFIIYKITANATSYPPGAILFPISQVSDIASINPIYSSTSLAPGKGSTNLIGVFLSDEGFGRYEHMSDDQLAHSVLERIPQVVDKADWTTSAEAAHIQRWPMALPRFGVGHVRRIDAFMQSQKGRRIQFAGDYLGGPYIDGAVRSGAAAADALSGTLS